MSLFFVQWQQGIRFVQTLLQLHGVWSRQIIIAWDLIKYYVHRGLGCVPWRAQITSTQVETCQYLSKSIEIGQKPLGLANSWLALLSNNLMMFE